MSESEADESASTVEVETVLDDAMSITQEEDPCEILQAYENDVNSPFCPPPVSTAYEFPCSPEPPNPTPGILVREDAKEQKKLRRLNQKLKTTNAALKCTNRKLLKKLASIEFSVTTQELQGGPKEKRIGESPLFSCS